MNGIRPPTIEALKPKFKNIDICKIPQKKIINVPRKIADVNLKKLLLKRFFDI